jgi:hypothetical protein
MQKEVIQTMDGLGSVKLLKQIDRYFHFLNRIIQTSMILIYMRHVGRGGSQLQTNILHYGRKLFGISIY